jgi:DNA-binding GntR family transcriptional regulator
MGPVREAIRQLEAEGYITQIPRTGPIVAMLDAETVRSIYEIREALEACAAALFVVRASQADREEIRDIVEQIHECRNDTEYAYVIALMEKLYIVLFRGAGNAMIETILAPLTGRIHMLRINAASNARHRLAVCQKLKTFAKALTGDDPEKAAKIARERIRHGAAFAIESFAKAT